ncbi:MAG: YabP/YqfC family sporulation protein [Clostridia bacterium]|nr:YabP/YqfC family sporulation protein [Clostridia bacterium]
MQEILHQVTVEQQKTLTVSGVEGVLSFSDTKITLGLLGGKKLYVSGSGLKIAGFVKQSGTFTATGTVLQLSYGNKGFSGLFK